MALVPVSRAVAQRRTRPYRRALARRFALCTCLNGPTVLQEPSGKNGDVKVIYHRLGKYLFLGEVGVVRFCSVLGVKEMFVFCCLYQLILFYNDFLMAKANTLKLKLYHYF